MSDKMIDLTYCPECESWVEVDADGELEVPCFHEDCPFGPQLEEDGDEPDPLSFEEY